MRYPLSFVLAVAATLLHATLYAQQMITGQSAFADWNQARLGVLRKITLADLAAPQA